MTDLRFCYLIMISLGVTMVNSKLDFNSSILLAHCRASCLHKINSTVTLDKECRETSSCRQCWDTCRALQYTTDRTSFCVTKKCGRGCLEACQFQWKSSQLSPVQMTHHEELLSFRDSRVTWPASGLAVYVVTGLGQTLEPRAILPPHIDPETTRVLVVDWRGLVKVLSPSPVEQARSLVHKLGIAGQLGLVDSKKQKNLPNLSLETYNKGNATRTWKLKVVSTIHESSLVLAQISWEPQQMNADNQLVYLVTWEIDGGILRGNLLTNSSRVTLSLWPDNMYRIQAAIFDSKRPEDKSEPLILNTHLVKSQSSTSRVVSHWGGEHENTKPNHTSRHSLTNTQQVERSTQLVVGVAAAVVVFLVVTISLTWRWQHRLSLSHKKLVDEECGTPSLCRVFPPVVRLIADTHEVPDVYSSTDNLLQHN